MMADKHIDIAAVAVILISTAILFVAISFFFGTQ